MAQPIANPDLPTAETASFGKVAIKLGFITPAQLEEAVKVQATAAKAGLRKRLGEILIKKGYISPEQFNQILKQQTVKSKRIGAYELISKLGEGGMGSVFKARQVFMDRVIALKILSPKMAKNKDFRERFVREARAVAKLNHPHIVAGIDVGSADGYCYFAMEYVDGESLGQYIARKGGRLDELAALEYTRQTALALHHAHQNNLLHRDVKPDNILLDKERHICKLADLGLARSQESAEDDAQLTMAGQAVGTPFYISPEQARGSADLLPPTDIYSLGASLFHLLTGQVPFDGPTAAVIMTRHLTDPVPSVCRISPDVSAATEKIILRCMQKKPEDRYASAQLLAQDIERVIAELKSKGRDKSPLIVPEREREREREREVQRPREREREHERERERDSGELPLQETPMPTGTSSLSATRSFRRRRQKNDVVGAVVAVAFIVFLIWLLYVLSQRLPSKNPPPDSRRNVSRERDNPSVPQPQPQPQPAFSVTPGTPLPIKYETDGSFRATFDFEAEQPYFDVDPLLLPQEPLRRTKDRSDTTQNHVMKLARIKDAAGASMVRLMLAPDFQPSSTTSVSFQICVQSLEPASEVQVWWDHRLQGTDVRFYSKWAFKVKNGEWSKLEVQLDKVPLSRNRSRLLSDRPQFLAILVGRADENVEAYIDNVVLTDPGQARASGSLREAPVVAPPRREAPVVPAPERSRDAPVAPPPPKGGGEETIDGALKRAL